MRPKKIEALAGRRVLAVAANHQHSLFLVEGGDVYSCGDGAYGKLGHGDTASEWTPRRIEALADAWVQSISAGDSHSLCVLRDGRIYGWGCAAAGLGEDLTEYPLATPGSAGNYEWAPNDFLLSRQCRSPCPLWLGG